MRFWEIRDYITDAKVIIDGDVDITGIAYDSRKVERLQDVRAGLCCKGDQI